MNLKELEERYKEFEKVIRKLREIEKDIAQLTKFDTICVTHDCVTNYNRVSFSDDVDTEKVKAVVLSILQERKWQASMDGIFLLQGIQKILLRGEE